MLWLKLFGWWLATPFIVVAAIVVAFVEAYRELFDGIFRRR